MLEFLVLTTLCIFSLLSIRCMYRLEKKERIQRLRDDLY